MAFCIRDRLCVIWMTCSKIRSSQLASNSQSYFPLNVQHMRSLFRHVLVSFEEYVSCMVFVFLRFEVVVHLLYQLVVVVSAICRVWQTFLQASDFFPAINDECILLVEWCRSHEISEFPVRFLRASRPTLFL